MKPLIEWVEAHPTFIGTIIVPALALFSKRVRNLSARFFRWLFSNRILLREVAVDVREIKEEIRFSNDTSTKQEVAMLKKRWFIEFWRDERPLIEMDGDAQALHVSESACKLMGVYSPTDLHARNWLRYVDPKQIDDFLNAYKSSVKFKSDCDFEFTIKNKDGTDKGTWMLSLADVTPPSYSKTIYSGSFIPNDKTAKDVATAMHWSK